MLLPDWLPLEARSTSMGSSRAACRAGSQAASIDSRPRATAAQT